MIRYVNVRTKPNPFPNAVPNEHLLVTLGHSRCCFGTLLAQLNAK